MEQEQKYPEARKTSNAIRPELSVNEQIERITNMFSSPQFAQMMHELAKCDPEERVARVQSWADPVVLTGMGIPVADGATITMRYFYDDRKIDGTKIEGTIRKKVAGLPGTSLPDFGPYALCGGAGYIGCICGGA